MSDIYKHLSDCVENNTPAALCVIIKTQGSTPRKAGSKMLVFPDGKIIGTVGGGSFEHAVVEKAQQVIVSNNHLLFDHELNAKNDMACGGKVSVYIEAIGVMPKLYIFGAGHIGHKLAIEASKLHFDVTIIDERADVTSLIPNHKIKVITQNYKTVFDDLVFDNQTYIACLSHLHQYDQDIIAYCAKQEYAYLGMIGSKRKIATARKKFLDLNMLNEEEMATIDWPMGLDIACQTPEEIVISILAKLIDVRGKRMDR